MNSDIRIAISCPDHPKIIKLARIIGDKAFWHLVKFWCYTATSKPSGTLEGCDVDDIEIGAGWDGERGVFLAALIKLKLIDDNGGLYSVHDWSKHNGWASGAKERSEKARAAAKARWNKKNATSMNKHCGEHNFSNAPSPSPSPSHTTPNQEEEINIWRLDDSGMVEHIPTGELWRSSGGGGWLNIESGEIRHGTPFDEFPPEEEGGGDV